MTARTTPYSVKLYGTRRPSQEEVEEIARRLGRVSRGRRRGEPPIPNHAPEDATVIMSLTSFSNAIWGARIDERAHISAENYLLTTREIATAIGVQPHQIMHWCRRYSLFPEIICGKGREYRFTIEHAVALAAVKSLIDMGIKQSKACAAIKQQPIYDASQDPDSPYLYSLPGTEGPKLFPLSLDPDGRWVNRPGTAGFWLHPLRFLDQVKHLTGDVL